MPNKEIKGAIKHSFTLVHYDSPTPEQALVIEKFVVGKGVFVILPTGSGKNTLVFDYLRRTTTSRAHRSIVIVISPLTALMRDLVLVYASPEATLGPGYPVT